ncbi:MAG: MBL fold metallo-hydrolase [Candidatus Hodarchaeales archaeon]|jgi:7,8-dihydropterin-6-yl-methyl-4-(beta-D-ribofuranosyl)aminobenzene 5'-phosphate synthase
MAPQINLKSADRVEITTIVDNSFDILLSGSDSVKRFPLLTNSLSSPLPIAEHGFSALVDIKIGGVTRRILFDTGVSESGVLHNLNVLNIDSETIDTIVLSHGHSDHAMGIMGLLAKMGRKKIPLILHPDAYLPRKLILPNDYEINIPNPKKSELADQNIELIESVGPSMLFDETSLVSGEIARTTEFETGFPIHYAKRNGNWEPDPLVSDDQCLIINVRNKGLVILSGCGHAGIINTIRNAQSISGIKKVFAVIGGFHLSGTIFEPIIKPTTNELARVNPFMIVPGHCTGWKATHEIARQLPEAFVQNSVGTTFVI